MSFRHIPASINIYKFLKQTLIFSGSVLVYDRLHVTMQFMYCMTGREQFKITVLSLINFFGSPSA